ncbi:hypothetical protein [Mesonia aestuariivivens]|uniref:Lipoprotein n=1 Tax=Mesonia aestuariivivens TaxID=2796128 RepID=A0ABS6W1Y5_9FLAO|nr:hypothetical protein [Mesonia aestuariivivens]MBW2961853.1 hypothetical protein [Mesonia aestuariivivens]
MYRIKNKYTCILIVLCFALVTSCQKEEEAFEGIWENSGYYGTLRLEINKEGDHYSVLHSHIPPKKDHAHDHEHSDEKKNTKINAREENQVLLLEVDGKQQKAILSKDKTYLTAFDRKYYKKIN